MTKPTFSPDEERRIHALNLAVAAADRNPFRRDLEAGEFADRIVADAAVFAAYLADGTATASAATVGRCMRLSPDTFGTGHRVDCVLPFGHLGAHTDGEAHWTRMTDDDASTPPPPTGDTSPTHAGGGGR